MQRRSGRAQAMRESDAEALAATALAFLAEDAGRLVAFCRAAGIEPTSLAASAGERETLRAVLEHLAGDESMLLVFTSTRDIGPDAIHAAIRLLGGGGYVAST
ncbi:MAG: DUF3572 family protein [Hyphomicrobiales bacterium]|nr:DUF3572 family protein [Hyphomicrobiales bacterium]